MPTTTRELGPGNSRVTFANGTSLRSTLGSARVTHVTGGRTRSPERAVGVEGLEGLERLEDLDRAIREVGLREQESVELQLDASDRAAAAESDDQVTLTPAPAPDGIQVVLYIDESGGMSWHLPKRRRAKTADRSARAAPTRTTFTIDTRTEAARQSAAARSGERGIITKIGRKIFKVLVVPLSRVLAKPVTAIVGKIERKHRQNLVRELTPDNYGTRVTQEFSDWRRLSNGRSLLVVHGIFSSTHGVLSRLPKPEMAELFRQYEGRVIAFDHLTVTEDPEDNARFFLRKLREGSEGLPIDFDILCHSRGGIVSRVLAERGRALDPFANCAFRKVYFVATPNSGSPLADSDHMVDMIDVFTNMVTSFPDGPVTYSIEIVLSIVKLLVSTAERHLPGLAAMGTEGFIRALNKGSAATGTEYAAAAANYEPDPARDNGFFTGRFGDLIMDRVFENAANDLVVPHDGVFSHNGHPSFPIAQKMVFAEADRVWHSGFFAEPRATAHMKSFLFERKRSILARHVSVGLGDHDRRVFGGGLAGSGGGRMSGMSPGAGGSGGYGGGGGFGAGYGSGSAGSFRDFTGLGESSPATRSGGRSRGSKKKGGGGGRSRSAKRGASRPIAKARGARRAGSAKPRSPREATATAKPPRPTPPAASARASRATAEEVEVRREPHIDFHEWVRAGETNDLVARLADIVGPVDAAAIVALAIPRGKKSVDVVVSLSAPGFDVEPAVDQVMKIGRDHDARREQVTYKLTAREPGGAKPVRKEIRADFKLGNRRVGGVIHYTEVAPSAYRGVVRGDGRSHSEPFALLQDPTNCELEILATARDSSGRPPFQIRLDSVIPGESYRGKPAGELSFPVASLTRYMQDVFDNFTKKYKTLKTPKQRQAWRRDLADAVETLGKTLWSQLPQEFRDEYFRLRDKRKLPKSIQVFSDEMIIPWELIIPHRDGKSYEPLGVTHVMGRWRPGLGIKPPDQRLAVTKGVIVNPKYPATSALYWTIEEARELKGLLPWLEEVRPANSQSFKSIVKRSDFQLFHFTGHGEFSAKNADLSTLVLEASDTFAAVSFIGAAMLAKGQPLLYLNACSVGSSGAVLGRMGGFAQRCLMEGCSGIIAPYWQVSDASAKKFSVEFYGKLMSGMSIGRALQELRAENRKDPTFQAFTFFGDPWTKARLPRETVRARRAG